MEHPQYVSVNGIRTRYFEAGEGEPLLLIHGGSYGSYYNAEDWELNFDQFAARFHVVAFDKIGTGFTDNPPIDDGYVIGASVTHTYDLIQTLGLGRVHLLGHSRGGYTATRLTLEHPEVVDTLVIIDSSSLVTPPNPQYDVWEREALRIPDPHERYRYLVTANSFGDRHITQRYLDVAVEIERLEKTQVAKEKLAAGLDQQFKTDLVARQAETHEWIRSGRLRCPTLIVWAYNDPSATMERCGIPCMNLIMPSVPRSETHILNEAGHMCFREQPEAFNHAVIDFVERNRASRLVGSR